MKRFEMQPWMLWQKIEETMYLCDLRNETIYVLQDSAFEIAWRLFSENKDLELVIDEISKKYDVKNSIVKKDTKDLLHELEINEVVREI